MRNGYRYDDELLRGGRKSRWAEIGEKRGVGSIDGEKGIYSPGPGIYS